MNDFSIFRKYWNETLGGLVGMKHYDFNELTPHDPEDDQGQKMQN